MPLIRNKRELEGELIVDHRNSPGFTAADIVASEKMNLPCPVVPGGTVFKSAVITCRCCQVQVVLNPNRSRPRNYCTQEDRYICDGCAVLRQQRAACCKSFMGRWERFFELFKRGAIGNYRDEQYDGF